MKNVSKQNQNNENVNLEYIINLISDSEYVKLDDLTEKIVAGATPRTSIDSYWKNGTIPWMASGEIHKKRVYEVDKFITQEGYDNSSTKLVPKNSVLIALAGQGKTRGTVAINKIELCTNQSIATMIPNINKLDYNYLYYYLESKYEKLRLLSSSDGGRGGLNLKILKNLKIKNIPLETQQYISNFLLILDKKLIFMQKKHKNITRMKNQILSENISDIVRNNPKRKLKELFDFKKGNGLSKEKISSEGKYPVILYGELYTTYNEIIENVVSFSEYDEGVCSKKGDILIPASTTTKGIDLVTASVVQEDNVQLGGDINILRKKTNLNSIYVATFLKYDMKREILRLTQGSTIIHLYGKDLEDLEINLPNLEIQDNIANLLNFLIKKENLIQNEINELNKFKKGLLQKMFV